MRVFIPTSDNNACTGSSFPGLSEELQIDSERAELCEKCVCVVSILQHAARTYKVWFCSGLPKEINITSVVVTLRNDWLSASKHTLIHEHNGETHKSEQLIQTHSRARVFTDSAFLRAICATGDWSWSRAVISHLEGPRGTGSWAKKNGVKGQDHYVKPRLCF